MLEFVLLGKVGCGFLDYHVRYLSRGVEKSEWGRFGASSFILSQYTGKIVCVGIVAVHTGGRGP